MSQDSRGLEWLKKNKEKFGTQDGLPGAFQREMLFGLIKPGKMVMIELPGLGNDTAVRIASGRVVMKGPAGWVLNMGGAHGTPGIADERNVVWVVGVQLGKR